ncbi:hypothetical protein [Streptomyces avermitilis]|uniref:hypothetical protein n=1 Tax=Streptomyces avermitilis TaxID=33903 RepID=UPI0038299010
MDGQQSAEHNTSARGVFGAGVLNADQFRMNQALGNVDGSGGANDAAANAAGSMPPHKPKDDSVLVRFTLDVRVMDRVTDRSRPGRQSVGVRELTLPHPVVIRMPAPLVERILEGRGGGAKLQDPEEHPSTQRH